MAHRIRNRDGVEMGNGKTAGLGCFLVALAVVTIFVASGFNRVSAGQQAAVTRNGKLVGCEGPGLDWSMPIVTRYHPFNIRKQTYELVSGDPKASDSKADYRDWSISGKTKEGIDFWVFLTVQYHIDPARVCDNFAQFRTDERIQEQVVKFHTRSVVPQVLNQYPAEDLYLGNLQPISAQIADLLRPRFETGGVVLDFFELKRGDFDDGYEQTIRDKAAQFELAKQVAAQQETQRQQNEKDRIAAEGKKAADAIAAQNLADQERIAAQGDADAKTIRASADATAVAQQVAAYGGPENYVASLNAQALAVAGAVYVPSDAIIVVGSTPIP